MDSNQLQRSKDLDISYLQNRLDPEEILASLSIETASWKGNWLMCHCPNTNNHSNGDVNPSFGILLTLYFSISSYIRIYLTVG
jgi:hypothetical protein